jgi:hypothetical protein
MGRATAKKSRKAFAETLELRRSIRATKKGSLWRALVGGNW